MNIKYISFGILALAIIAVIIISGCINNTPPTTPECGNGVVESGEQCDNSGCSAGQTCNDQCVCETIQQAQSCNTPSDCGGFYDCVNSECVKIIPPVLP